jgi:uncharacterized protein (TIGR02646 family)
MIKLLKGAKPAVLTAKEAVWTAEFEALIANGLSTAKYRRYGHGDIKDALIAETRGKCAYCESVVTHLYWGDVEHILPKARRPEFVVTWENLTFACAKCNNAKDEYYDEDAPLIDPYTDEPDQHFVFAGGIIRHKPGSAIGSRSWQRLDLQRNELVQRRGARLSAVGALIDVWFQLADGSDKDLARDAIMSEAASDKEFSAAVKAFIKTIAGLEPGRPE